MAVPKSYRTIEEFEREELRPQYKVGFSLDDLMQETMLRRAATCSSTTPSTSTIRTTTTTTTTDAPRRASCTDARRVLRSGRRARRRSLRSTGTLPVRGPCDPPRSGGRFVLSGAFTPAAL